MSKSNKPNANKPNSNSNKSNSSENSQSSWMLHELASQYQQKVAKDIANLYSSFRSMQYFSEDFLTCPSWRYASVCNGKQFEIDLIAKVGRNGRDSEDLILPNFFYSISGKLKN